MFRKHTEKAPSSQSSIDWRHNLRISYLSEDGISCVQRRWRGRLYCAPDTYLQGSCKNVFPMVLKRGQDAVTFWPILEFLHWCPFLTCSVTTLPLTTGNRGGLPGRVERSVRREVGVSPLYPEIRGSGGGWDTEKSTPQRRPWRRRVGHFGSRGDDGETTCEGPRDGIWVVMGRSFNFGWKKTPGYRETRTLTTSTKRWHTEKVTNV